MALRINTNVASVFAQKHLSRTGERMAGTMEHLSSGMRITKAADDAAGLAVSEKMRAQIRSLRMAQRNTSDGISMVQTAEGSLAEVTSIMSRMRELAVEAANDSLSDTERGFLDTEFQDLETEITRISDVTEFNGINLLDGTAGAAGTMTFQVGTRNSANDRITVDLTDQDSTALGVNASAVATRANAQDAIDEIDVAMESLNTDRASLGATINSLNVAVTNLGSTIENYGSAVGTIRDADIGLETAEFSKHQVLQQAGVAMLAQANALPTLALRLLG